MPECRVLIGDWIEQLRTLPDESANCCVTSPPYWGLRDYGVAGQIGLETTLDEYVAKLVEGFREVKRVLRKDGTLWLNLGDSYNSVASWGRGAESSTLGRGRPRGWRNGSGRADGIVDERGQRNRNGNCVPGLKTKDLVGIPWMTAFALRADDWFLRQDIIWAKTNPMPEPVRDRCTKSHEYIFLLSKSERYYFDSGAIKEPAKEPERQRNDRIGGANGHTVRHSLGGMIGASSFRNKRDVWTVSTQPYSEAHFATFPPKLIEPCVLAGSPPEGTVLDPFGGSGTTGEVALKHGRNAILIELNEKYKPLIDKRVLTSRRQAIIPGV